MSHLLSAIVLLSTLFGLLPYYIAVLVLIILALRIGVSWLLFFLIIISLQLPATITILMFSVIYVLVRLIWWFKIEFIVDEKTITIGNK